VTGFTKGLIQAIEGWLRRLSNNTRIIVQEQKS
jgi:hypothetical protein